MTSSQNHLWILTLSISIYFSSNIYGFWSYFNDDNSQSIKVEEDVAVGTVNWLILVTKNQLIKQVERLIILILSIGLVWLVFGLFFFGRLFCQSIIDLIWVLDCFVCINFMLLAVHNDITVVSVSLLN